jgi:PAS domain S-box-containing protein
VELTASPFPALALVAAAVSGGLARYAWTKRSGPGATAFVGLTLAVAAWSTVEAVNLAVHHPPSFHARSGLRWFLGTLVPVFGLAFALEYTGHRDLLSPWTVLGLLSLPAVSTFVVLTGDPWGVWYGTCSAAAPPGAALADVVGGCRRGPLFYAHVTYAYTMVLFAAGVVVRALSNTGSPYGWHAVAFVVGAAVPALANVAWLFGLVPVAGVDPTAPAFTAMGLAWGYAALDSRFLEVVPATSRIGQRAAIADLEDGVAILDERDRVIRLNEAATDLFGWDADAAVGESVRTVVGDDSFAVEPGDVVAEFDPGDGKRTLEVTVSTLRDAEDRQVGHTLVFRDVTERRQRKQQLEALNRVLRHNLRNDMNVVKGYADTLAERTTDPEAGMAEFIAEQSAELVAVGSKVRNVERIMQRRRSEFRRFDLGTLLGDVVEDVRTDYPAGRAIVELPRELWVRSDDLIVETVVRNLVHNAFEHNDADGPSVRVSATTSENGKRWVDVVVADNGPGIPEQERTALRTGQETALQHGSGLGLWVVHWGVTTLGGELSIEDREGRGTLVRVRIPGLADPPEGDAEESVPPGVAAE